MQRKGKAIFSSRYLSQNKYFHGRRFSKPIPITAVIRKTYHKNENDRYDFRGQLHVEGSR